MGIIIFGIIIIIFIMGIFANTNYTRMSLKEEENFELLKYDPKTNSYKNNF